MGQQRIKRKLATIFSADVAGYSRLMNADEEDTFTRLTAYRVIVDDLIDGHGGRVFGTAGDSVIAEFESAVDAVRGAVAKSRSGSRPRMPVSTRTAACGSASASTWAM